MLLQGFELPLEVVLHVLVPALDGGQLLDGGKVSELAVIGVHQLTHVVHLVIEELIRLSHTVAQLLEGLFQPFEMFFLSKSELAVYFLIQATDGVIYVFVRDTRPKELLTVFDAPERFTFDVVDIFAEGGKGAI